MKDAVVLGALVGSFATWVTVHLVIVARLLARRPRWRGPAALVVVPLAPWWAFAERWRWSTAMWVGSVATYALARAFA